MIISDRKEFIFIHCRKTAGSSIKSYLNRYLGTLDVQTAAWHNAIKNGGSYNVRFWLDLLHPSIVFNPKTYKNIASEILLKNNIHKKLNELHKKKYSYFVKPGHESAAEIKKHFPIEWESYYSFCFVRNPYKKVVSDYIWRVKQSGIDVSFLEFLREIDKSSPTSSKELTPKWPSNWPLYTIDDKVVVDRVGKFENLADDFEFICSQIDVEFVPDELPRAKKVKDYSYKEYYNKDAYKIVSSLYSNEIEYFGYSF